MRPTTNITHTDRVDVNKQASYVSFLFKQKIQPISNVIRQPKVGSALYNIHCDFSYLVHDLTNGYMYRRHQVYTTIIDFINNIDVDATLALHKK